MKDSPSVQPSQPPQVLTCWKDIARFFGKGIRTVQRWEKQMGMPVHRPGFDRTIVFADPEELRRWAFATHPEAENAAKKLPSKAETSPKSPSTLAGL